MPSKSITISLLMHVTSKLMTLHTTKLDSQKLMDNKIIQQMIVTDESGRSGITAEIRRICNSVTMDGMRSFSHSYSDCKELDELFERVRRGLRHYTKFGLAYEFLKTSEELDENGCKKPSRVFSTIASMKHVTPELTRSRKRVAEGGSLIYCYLNWATKSISFRLSESTKTGESTVLIQTYSLSSSDKRKAVMDSINMKFGSTKSIKISHANMISLDSVLSVSEGFNDKDRLIKKLDLLAK